MSVSPEIIPFLTFSLAETFSQQPGAPGDFFWGDSWLALGFRKGSLAQRALFFCWDPLYYCCTLAPERDVRALLEQRAVALPIGHAVKAHLSGARITRVEQLYQDRVLRCTFEKLLGAGFVQKKYLLLELTGRYSNCILLDEDETVLETAKHIHPGDNSYRHILPGHPYSPPPPGNFLPLREVAEALEKEDTEPLRRARGLGKSLIEHILGHYSRLSPRNWGEKLRKMEALSEEPLLLQEIPGGELTVFPEPLPEAREIPKEELFSRLWEMSGRELLRRCMEKKRGTLSRELRQNLKRTRHKIRGMEQRLARAEGADLWKKKGQLLLGSPGAIPRGASVIEMEDWENPGTFISVEMEASLGAAANAERYFQKYKKARGSVEESRKTLESLYQQEEEEDTLLSLLESCENLEELQAFEAEAPVQKSLKKKGAPNKRTGDAPSRPYLELDLPSLRGHIYVGMNTRGNRRVTFDIATSGDLWFHAQKIPGAHVILRSTRSEHHPQAIALAASLAAFYSKGKNSLALPVDYAPVQHVKHIPGKGIAHVRYANFATLRIEPKSLKTAAAESLQAPDPGEPEKT